MATHAHPPLFRRLAAFGAVFSAGTIAVIAALPVLAPAAGNAFLVGTGLLSAACCLWASVSMLGRAGDTVEVGDDGLRYHSPGRDPVFLPWEDVARVEPQNVMQRLLATDATGSRRITMEYHLENFGELRRTVLDRAGERRERTPA